MKITSEEKVRRMKEVIDDESMFAQQKVNKIVKIADKDIDRPESKRDKRGKVKAGKGAEYRVVNYTREFYMTDKCAKRIPVSGTARGFKGDVVFDAPDMIINEKFSKFLIENKKTSAVDYMSFQRNWLEKIKGEAEEQNRIGIVTFEFHSSPIYVALEYELFLNLLLHLQG